MDVKSFRVTRDRAGRWHVAFAVIPGPVPGPGTGEVVGVDRGVRGQRRPVHRARCCTVPACRAARRGGCAPLERKLAKARRGSSRRGQAKAAVARLKAREAGPAQGLGGEDLHRTSRAGST